MRNTSSPFCPPKGEAVPHARSPLFQAPGKADSCLSFRPQGKCHLAGEAFPTAHHTRVILSHRLVISSCAITGSCLASQLVYCPTRLHAVEKEDPAVVFTVGSQYLGHVPCMISMCCSWSWKGLRNDGTLDPSLVGRTGAVKARWQARPILQWEGSTERRTALLCVALSREDRVLSSNQHWAFKQK